MPSKRILFIGNSFTNRNDMPAIFTRLAAAVRPPWQIEADRVIANGVSLKTHWSRGIALDTIRRSRWDYVVLQEQSTLPLKNRAKMHEYIRLFDSAIREHAGRTVLYLTWARAAELDRQDELSDAYLSVGREIGALVVPVGVAWQRVLRGRTPVALHDRDGSHPSAAGSYLAACVFVAALMRVSPVGLPGTTVLDAGATLILQQAAWEAVRS